jgi:hypothetical protein
MEHAMAGSLLKSSLHRNCRSSISVNALPERQLRGTEPGTGGCALDTDQTRVVPTLRLVPKRRAGMPPRTLRVQYSACLPRSVGWVERRETQQSTAYVARRMGFAALYPTPIAQFMRVSVLGGIDLDLA